MNDAATAVEALEASPLVSVIIPLRNRGGERLANCLRSLRWQGVTADKVEIILSDFGSDPPFDGELRAFAQTFQARVVRFETREVWNRAKALNVGIRASHGRYILCTDADMIFQPNFIGTLVAAQQRTDDASLVVCRCRDLPESVPEQAWEAGAFSKLLDASTYRERLGTGACQMAPRSFFYNLRGFDEGYKFWGLEDTDMTFRARRHGQQVTWVHDETAMLHQWHPTDRNKRPFRKFMNDARFHVTKYIRRKNPMGWGGQK